MTCIVRADAGPAMGGGHLMRCLALALAYRAAGGDVVFLSCCDSARLRARVRAAGFRLVDAAAMHPDPADAGATLALARETGAVWAVVDGYHFDPGYHAALRSAGLRVLALADMVQWAAYDVDLLLDQNADAPHLAFPVGDATRLLAGPHFALLRPEFAAARAADRVLPAEARRILVTLGAGAPGDGRRLVLDALARSGLAGLEVRVVVGPADPALEASGHHAGNGAAAEYIADPADLPGLMAWADLAVSAGGITTWELACLGVPTLQLILADNQRGPALEMARLGLTRCLGEVGVVGPQAVAEEIGRAAGDRAWREAVARDGRRLLDGRGAERVARAMREDAEQDGALALRPATADDALFLWGLANDPAVRAAAFHPEVIPLDAHLAWLERRLGSDATRLWILEQRGCPIGQVRYDRVSPEVAEIDYAVAAAYRGRGLGHAALRLSAALAATALGVRRLRGDVLAANVASGRAFEAAGFVRAAEAPAGAAEAVVRYERVFA
jgi:UDP-2,4-diacetamido-2,4,6-trideoxy-beta-L-altropyranose hydrolase